MHVSNIMNHMGPPLWESMHWIASTYPTEPTEIDVYWSQMYVESLYHSLRCPTCYEHFGTLLREYPIQNYSREAFFQWTIDMHNKVNERLGKSFFSREQASERYSAKQGQCTETKYTKEKKHSFVKHSITFLLLVVLCILFFFLGYSLNNKKL